MLTTCCASEMTSPPSMINERFEEKEHTFIYFSIFIFTNTDYLVQMCYKGGVLQDKLQLLYQLQADKQTRKFFIVFIK